MLDYLVNQCLPNGFANRRSAMLSAIACICAITMIFWFYNYNWNDARISYLNDGAYCPFTFGALLLPRPDSRFRYPRFMDIDCFAASIVRHIFLWW